MVAEQHDPVAHPATEQKFLHRRHSGFIINYYIVQTVLFDVISDNIVADQTHMRADEDPAAVQRLAPSGIVADIFIQSDPALLKDVRCDTVRISPEAEHRQVVHDATADIIDGRVGRRG